MIFISLKKKLEKNINSLKWIDILWIISWEKSLLFIYLFIYLLFFFSVFSSGAALAEMTTAVSSQASSFTHQYCPVKEVDRDNGIVGSLSSGLLFYTAPSILRHSIVAKTQETLAANTIFNARFPKVII